MRSVRLSLMLLSVFLLMAGTVLARDPGNRDTVRVAKVTTNAGQKVGVPVTLYNDEALGGYTLGFKWNSSAVSIDSISYIGTRLNDFQDRLDTLNNPAQVVLIGMADQTGHHVLPRGDGLLFTIWFAVAPGAPDQFVEIDSAFFPPAGKFILSPSSGVSISPEFIKGQIKIGNPQTAVIVLSKSSFTFAGMAGGTNPTSQVQQITNAGGQPLSWTATKLAPWLVLTPSEGITPSVMVVAVNTVGMSDGTYSDTVIVSAPGANNTPQKFSVTLTLAIPPPTIKLTPNSFHFQAQQNSTNPPGQTLSITNIDLGTLNWSATNNSTWLTLSSYSGTAPSSVTLNVDCTGLPAGAYVDSIRISDPTATNSPQYAVVTFEIFSEFPVILPSPASIYAVASGTENPYTRTLLIQNNGGGVMNWHLAKTHTWMSLDRDSGTAIQGDPGVVIVNFDRSLVPAFGQYYDTIVITSTNAINSPVVVPVVFSKEEDPQTMNVSTNVINFSEYECGSYPGVGPQYFSITYFGGAEPAPVREWTLTHKESWLTANPTSGTVTRRVTLSVSLAGLTPGVYQDTIVVSSEGVFNPPEKVVVTFTVLATPSVIQIGLTRDSLLYIYNYTLVSSVDQNLVIYSNPGGCLDWQATSDVAWLTPIPASGSKTQTVRIRSNAVGVPLGRHEGKVTFTANAASNSPRELPVVLWVYAPGDADGDGFCDVADAVYILNYIFAGGPAPVPLPLSGDVDCSLTIDVNDVVWLLDYIFKGGPSPCLW
jgi:hypothetical protein